MNTSFPFLLIQLSFIITVLINLLKYAVLLSWGFLLLDSYISKLKNSFLAKS